VEKKLLLARFLFWGWNKIYTVMEKINILPVSNVVLQLKTQLLLKLKLRKKVKTTDARKDINRRDLKD
jgi:hypothetical protein